MGFVWICVSSCLLTCIVSGFTQSDCMPSDTFTSSNPTTRSWFKMHSTIKGPYRKQTKYIRKHAHFSNTYLEKAMEKQPKHHAPPGFHTLFEEYCSFVLGDFQGQMSHCLEFSSSMAVFPLLPYELPRQGAACVLAYRSSANRTSSK